MSTSPLVLARRFFVDDLPGAEVPFTRIQGILEGCLAGKPLSSANEQFLRSRGLAELVEFAKCDVDEETFRRRAVVEQQLRQVEFEEKRVALAAKAKLAAEQAEARQAAMWAEHNAARLREEQDPRNIARRKNRELRDRFGVYGYVEEDYPRLMRILRTLGGSQRLEEAELAWLASNGREFRTTEVMFAFHRIEANYFLQEFKSTGNIWHAVSASSHLRKCNASKEADDLLSAIPQHRLSQAKLKSAVFTTHGGALRDLHRLEEAKDLASKAHALLPSDYRPCTLLGAIHIELDEISAGHEWYTKAEARGAPPQHVERDLRVVLLRLTETKRTEIIKQLIAISGTRYEWLRNAFRGGSKGGKAG